MSSRTRRRRPTSCGRRHPLYSPAQTAPPLRPKRLSRAQPDRAHVLPPQGLRRIATRYDKLARNFIAGTLFAAIAIWWINWVWTRDRGHEGQSSSERSPIGRPVVVRKGGATPATLARLLPSDIRYIVRLDLYIL